MGKAFTTIFRILTFRAKREELEPSPTVLIGLALLTTWIVGLGRWWDDPRDLLWFVRFGLGSVIYVLGLSGVLFLVTWPLWTQKLGYLAFLAFVASTSLPGLVYAVPIERWTDVQTAATYNFWALTFVSLYRLALLIWFLGRIVGLSFLGVVATTFFPISLIVFLLSMLGHGAAVMDIMGGFRENITAKSEMEAAVGFLGCLSWVVAPLSLVLYLAELPQAASRRSEAKARDS